MDVSAKLTTKKCILKWIYLLTNYLARHHLFKKHVSPNPSNFCLQLILCYDASMKMEFSYVKPCTLT